MPLKNKKFWEDLIERTLWTGIQAALAVLTVGVADLENSWVIPIAIALAAIKAQVARKLGDPDSASTLTNR